MINFKKIFLTIAALFLVAEAFAMISMEKSKIIPRHFTINPPFKIKSVEADTSLPNFSVVKTSDNTFDVLWDYFLPDDMYSHASVKLWVMNGNDINYAHFVNYRSGLGIQFIECGGCPYINKIDYDNYEFTYK